MRKIISFMHISLDGYVSGTRGEMDWIKVDEEIFDHGAKRISACDTALYGRTTYQMMEDYWPTAADQPTASKHDIEHAQWYKKVQKIVMSKTLKDPVSKQLKIINEHLPAQLNELKQSGTGDEILLFGSPSATHSLIQLNLIDGYWLFVNPVILGKGVPLFADIKQQIQLKLSNTRQFSCGVTELNYMVEKH